MKLNKNFILHNTDTETILVSAGNTNFSGIVRGNHTLGAILALLKNDTTEEHIADEIKAMYDAPEGAVEGDVKKALQELKRIGALDE